MKIKKGWWGKNIQSLILTNEYPDKYVEKEFHTINNISNNTTNNQNNTITSYIGTLSEQLRKICTKFNFQIDFTLRFFIKNYKLQPIQNSKSLYILKSVNVTNFTVQILLNASLCVASFKNKTPLHALRMHPESDFWNLEIRNEKISTHVQKFLCQY